MIELKGRDVLTTNEWTKDELDQVLDLAIKFKSMGDQAKSLDLLKGKEHGSVQKAAAIKVNHALAFSLLPFGWTIKPPINFFKSLNHFSNLIVFCDPCSSPPTQKSSSMTSQLQELFPCSGHSHGVSWGNHDASIPDNS